MGKNFHILPFDFEKTKRLRRPDRIGTQNGGKIDILSFESGAKYEPIVAVYNDEFIRTYDRNGKEVNGYSKLVLIVYEKL